MSILEKEYERVVKQERMKPFICSKQSKQLFAKLNAIGTKDQSRGWSARREHFIQKIKWIELQKVQAKKSIWWMPWHREPKKDVTSCDKLRGAANKLRSADFRMWEHAWWRIMHGILNQIGMSGEPPELKHLSRGRKRNQTRFRK